MPAFAGEPIAKMMVSGSNVWFDPLVPNAGFALSVAGPDGVVQESRFAAGETPFFTPGQGDGVYLYELRALSAETTRVEGAAGAELPAETGSFSLTDGAIQSAANSTAVESATALVQEMSELFSWLTIQANNTQILFDDDSTAVGFPNNDWKLFANDGVEGGANYFAIQDVTADTVPFRVNAGAPDNALWVNGNGYVGIGVPAAARPLHIRRGLDPTVRFEQTAITQVWDLWPSELGFRVVDTTANTTPFRIDRTAPTDSLYITNLGYLGLGVNPARQLHLRGPNATFRMDRSANTAAFILCRVDGAGNVWKSYIVGTDGFGVNNGQFIIADSGTGAGGASTNRFVIQNDGTVVMPGLVLAGTYGQLSSAALKTNVRTIDQALDLVNRLRGVRFDWKEGGKPGVGLIAEEVEKVIPELVTHDATDGKVTGVQYSNVVAVLVEAMKSQQSTIDKQQESIAKQEAELSNLKSELEKLKARLQ